MAKKDVYVTICGERAAQRIAEQKRAENPRATVRVESGSIPEWGSGIPSSSTYGATTKGHRIIVEKNK